MIQQINLYDSQLERRRDWLALHNVAGIVVAAAIIVAALGIAERVSLPDLAAQMEAGEKQIQEARNQLTALARQMDAHKADTRFEQEIAAKRQLLSARSEVLAVLKQGMGPDAYPFAEYLRGFARQTVNGLWLTAFAMRADGSMEISGRTVDPALIPEYIRRLNREQAFRGQTFAALRLAEAQGDAAGGAAGRPLGRRPPWHEFTLIPVAGSEAGTTAQSTPQASGRVG